MNLREQIKELHLKRLGPELQAYREDRIPQMVDDLVRALFDAMSHVESVHWMDERTTPYWYLRDTVEIRAIKKARSLIAETGLTNEIPAVE